MWESYTNVQTHRWHSTWKVMCSFFFILRLNRHVLYARSWHTNSLLNHNRHANSIPMRKSEETPLPLSTKSFSKNNRGLLETVSNNETLPLQILWALDYKLLPFGNDVAPETIYDVRWQRNATSLISYPSFYLAKYSPFMDEIQTPHSILPLLGVSSVKLKVRYDHQWLLIIIGPYRRSRSLYHNIYMHGPLWITVTKV